MNKNQFFKMMGALIFLSLLMPLTWNSSAGLTLPQPSSIAITSNSSILITPSNVSVAENMFSNNITEWDVIFTGNITTIIINQWVNTGSLFIKDEVNLTLNNSFINGTIQLENTAVLTTYSTIIKTLHVFDQVSLSLYDTNISKIYNGNAYANTWRVSAVVPVLLSNTSIDHVIDNMRNLYETTNISVIGLHFNGDLYGMNFTLKDNSYIGRADIYVFIGKQCSLSVNGQNKPYYYQIQNTWGSTPLSDTVITIINATMSHDNELTGTFGFLTNVTLVQLGMNLATISMKFNETTITNFNGKEHSQVILTDTPIVHINNSTFYSFSTKTSIDPLSLITTQGKVYLNSSTFESLQLLNYQLNYFNQITAKELIKLAIVLGNGSIGPGFSIDILHVSIFGKATSNIPIPKYDFYVPNNGSITISGSIQTIGIHGSNINVTLKDGIYYHPFDSEFWENNTITLQNVKIYNVSLSGDRNTYKVINSYMEREKSIYYVFGGINTSIIIEASILNMSIDLYGSFFNLSHSFLLNLKLSGVRTPSILSLSSSTINYLELYTISPQYPYYWYFYNTTIKMFYSYISSFTSLHIWLNHTELSNWKGLHWESASEIHFDHAFFRYPDVSLSTSFKYYKTKVKIIWDQSLITDVWDQSYEGKALIERKTKQSINSTWSSWEIIGESQNFATYFVDNNITPGYFNDYRVKLQYTNGYFFIVNSRFTHYFPTDFFAVGVGITVNLTIETIEENQTHYYTGIHAFDATYVPPGGKCWWWGITNSDPVVMQVEVLWSNGTVYVPRENVTDTRININFTRQGDYIVKARASSDMFRFWGNWTELKIHIESQPTSTIPTSSTTEETNEPQFLPVLPFATISFLIVPVLIKRRKK